MTSLRLLDQQIQEHGEAIADLELLLFKKLFLVEGLTIRVHLGVDPLNPELSVHVIKNAGHVLTAILHSLQGQQAKLVRAKEKEQS